MKRFAAAVLLLMPCLLWGDTVRFKDGTSLDGVVSRPSAGKVQIQSGKARLTYDAGAIESIEANDKTGDASAVAAVAGRRHQQLLQERTGLTREQRDQVRALINGLWSPDERERRVAREKLVELGKKIPVYQYVEQFIPYSKGTVLPELIQVLTALDPKSARSTLLMQAQSPSAQSRAAMMSLIANGGNKEDGEVVARGMIDVEPSVRIAAADAIAKMNVRGATPLLIENLTHQNERVRNASMEALKSLWKESANGDEESWRRLWEKRRKEVDGEFNSGTLAPLVSKEDLENVNPNHDE